MRKTIKIAIIAALAFLALTAVAIAFAYSQNASLVNANEQQMGYWGNRAYFNSDNSTLQFNGTSPCYGRGPMMHGNSFTLNEGFLQNATLATVNGTVVSEVKGLLVLDTGSGEVRVMLPQKWTVGTEVVSRANLFNGTFASAGQTVTVNVLESEVFSNTSFSINEMLAYQVTNATGTVAYAVLPFNIQPSS